jgi:hypothetical protein
VTEPQQALPYSHSQARLLWRAHVQSAPPPCVVSTRERLATTTLELPQRLIRSLPAPLARTCPCLLRLRRWPACLRRSAPPGGRLPTLKRRAAIVARAQNSAGLMDPGCSEAARLVLRAMSREVGTQQEQAAGFNERDTDRLAHLLDTSTAPRDVEPGPVAGRLGPSGAGKRACLRYGRVHRSGSSMRR